MSKPRTWDDIPGETVTPGHSRQAFRGDNLMVVRNLAEPGVGVEMHSHPHEQLVYIVRGQLEMHCRGEVHILGPAASTTSPAARPTAAPRWATSPARSSISSRPSARISLTW